LERKGNIVEFRSQFGRMKEVSRRSGDSFSFKSFYYENAFFKKEKPQNMVLEGKRKNNGKLCHFLEF
jgi:hypothetical protein